MNRALKKWMTAATVEQQEQLAIYAKTSVGTLRQLTTGHRKASSALAIRLEKGAQRMLVYDLPPLTRMDLNETCRGCEYAKLATCKPTSN
jgi:hypothetical protein